jgi:hypothetical protein
VREDQIVLHFDTVPGTYPDTVIAAQALIDWVDLAHKAAAAIAPSERLVIEIVGVKEGSSRFPQLLRWLNEQGEALDDIWKAYPHLKRFVVGSAHVLATSTVAAAVTLAMQPDQQTVSLSEADRALLRPLQERVAASPDVQAASRKFYRTIEVDKAITGVGVAPDWESRPALIVPRSEFHERGGLWDMEEDGPAEEYRHAIWEVVLLRPNLVSKPQPWQFSRDGFKFSAQMADAHFLVALREGRVPLNMQEGVIMRVEVEYKERLIGQVWEAVPQSRRVTRVLSPAPLPKSSP